MNNDFVISPENRNKVLNYFLNNLALKVADDYLELLEKNKKIPNPILEFLDQSIFLTRKKVNIEKINSKLVDMTKEETELIQSSLIKETEYKRLYWMLNFIFNVIKEKELQEKLFSWIYNDFLNYKKDKEIKNKKNNIDIVFKKLLKNNKNINFSYKYQY